MTAFDDDPEYEAQLKEVLGDQHNNPTSWTQSDDVDAEEMGDFIEGGDDKSEDGVLDDAPTFRMKLPPGETTGKELEEVSGEGVLEGRALSEDARSISTGDDSPSVQGSEATLSAPATPSKLNGYGYLSPARAFSPSRRFDVRQHQRLSSYSSLPSGLVTPSSMHSRPTSVSSHIADIDNLTPSDTPNVPWEVVRWTKLRKIEGQAFSEIGKRKFGSPTAIASAGVIAIGTSKGLVLIFDFRQSLRHVIGIGTKAAQSGPVTALTLSADHTVLLCGHASGEIFTWDLSKPTQPHSHTPALNPEQISSSKRDGHITGTAILHVDFLGLRHGAFVTADETGMAFVHHLSRKFVVANISTTRILGRYPERVASVQRPVKPHKPSCVLGMASLPLGSVKFITDEMQLVAMLSPYKLVIVSVIPFAQTQLRVARPKRASPDGSILSGCLAWYPCVKSTEGNETITKPKLAYTWDRYLAVLQVSEIKPDKEDAKEGPPRLQFSLTNEWIGEETIVAMQWLLQQVLVLLTVSQRLLILDTSTMQVTASCDLLMKQVLHFDRFSNHMSNFPAVADAYYHSFKTYKHKIFLLCSEDIQVGSLLTWADRVLALVEAADFIQAINLTSSYYKGRTEKITLGLPENDDERHTVVQDKLTEMVIASLKYTFSHKQEVVGENSFHAEVAQQKLVKDLTAACIDACIAMDAPMFLFDEVYEVFEEYEQTDAFIEVLEPYILKDQIQDVPPSIMKDITSHFVTRNLPQRLEQVICHINPASLDIDQITTICRQHGLYDALSYVYNNALKDYITPMVEFVGLVRGFFAKHQANGSSRTVNLRTDERDSIAFKAFKVFPYLSYTLTGRIYPTGEEMSESDAHEAKQAIYYFLFSGRTLSWPRDRGQLIRTTNSEESSEPTFPYLRLFLRFDAPTLFQALDEAFEDRFLNGNESTNGTTNGLDSFGRAINRQLIIDILLDVMSSDPSSDIVYLYMYIARNLPKYPQFILLSGSTIEGILFHLCTYGQTEMAEEAQLAAEYLLSVFKPSDSEKMIQAYHEAKFFRILKSTLRMEGRYTELVDVYLEDENKTEVFECVDGLLRSGSSLNSKQREALKAFVLEKLLRLATIDVSKTAEMFEQYLPERQKDVVQRLEPDRATSFVYLDTVISKALTADQPCPSWIDADIREQYISLMCAFKPMELTRYLDTLAVHDIRIEKVLPVLEQYNVIDAIVLVLRRAGMTKEAMHKIIIYIASLQQELSKAVRLPRDHESDDAADIAVSEVQRYAFVGADLCEHFSKDHPMNAASVKGKGTASLNEAEQLWLSLLEALVGVSREVASSVSATPQRDESALQRDEEILNSLRNIVQDVFTRLFTLTSSAASTLQRRPTNISFIAILRKFLSNLGASQLTSLRPILSTIFDAYRYEKQLIQVTSKLVGADLFQTLLKAKSERERGWRALSTNCMGCARILFGPGAKGSIFAKWERRRVQEEDKKLARTVREGMNISGSETHDGKGKGKSVDLSSPIDDDKEDEDIEGDIVVFGCGHGYHRTCLEELVRNSHGEGEGEGEDGSVESGFRCIVCDAH